LPETEWLEAPPESRLVIGEKAAHAFFRIVRRESGRMSQSTTCTCNACTHIEKPASQDRPQRRGAVPSCLFNFLELAGVDVIVVHRLLKNLSPPTITSS
jgi:hypothetical protein